jgi:pilus assembly protein Flp/PilA
MKKIIDFIKDEEGASLIEYALLVALIAVAAIAAMQLLGERASSTLQNVADQMPGGGGEGGGGGGGE